MFNDDDKKEMEEVVDAFIEMSGNVLDKMIEAEMPKKIATLAKAYRDAFVESGFSSGEAVLMVKSILQSQALSVKN